MIGTSAGKCASAGTELMFRTFVVLATPSITKLLTTDPAGICNKVLLLLIVPIGDKVSVPSGAPGAPKALLTTSVPPLTLMAVRLVPGPAPIAMVPAFTTPFVILMMAVPPPLPPAVNPISITVAASVAFVKAMLLLETLTVPNPALGDTAGCNPIFRVPAVMSPSSNDSVPTQIGR